MSSEWGGNREALGEGDPNLCRVCGPRLRKIEEMGVRTSQKVSQSRLAEFTPKWELTST